MSEITITKKYLTTEQKQYLTDVGFKAAEGLTGPYYELTPHAGTFSNPVSISMHESFGHIFKFPDFNNLSSKDVEIFLNNGPIEVDSFSNLVGVFNGSSTAEAVNGGQLPPYEVVGANSDNDNYLVQGLQSLVGARFRGDADFMLLAGLFQAAMDEISPGVESVPFLNTSTVQSIVGKPLDAQTVGIFYGAGGGGDKGWNFRRAGSPTNLDSNWPNSLYSLSIDINKSSSIWESQQPAYKTKNLFYKAVFESLGYNRDVIQSHFFGGNSSDFSKGTQLPLLGGGERDFCTNAGVLAKYRAFSCIDDVAGAPMSLSKPWFFAAGHDKDSINETAFDFYFSEEVVGGPLNEPVPHPALHREILSYNDKNGLDEFHYDRPDMTEKAYQSPGYIVTREAMQMLGVQFKTQDKFGNSVLDNGLDDVRISHYHPGNQTVEVNNLESDIEADTEIRSFTKEKYLIKPVISTDTVLKHIMYSANRVLPYEQEDKSVKQALRYFGFVPYGTVDVVGSSLGFLGKRAIVIENGEVKDELKNIYNNLPNVNCNFYISANRAWDHQDLGLVALGEANDALAKLFNAEAVQVKLCIGNDPVDSEIEQDTTRDGVSEHRRFILVRKDRS